MSYPNNPPTTDGSSFFDAIRRTGLVRPADRWIGGVASGVALRFGIDATLVRVLWFIAGLFGGLGVALYAIGWALLPEQADGRIHLQELLRGHFDIAQAGIIAMLALAGPWSGGWFAWVLPASGVLGELAQAFAIIGILGIAVAVIVAAVRSSNTRGPAPHIPRPAPPVPPAPHTAAASDFTTSSGSSTSTTFAADSTSGADASGTNFAHTTDPASTTDPFSTADFAPSSSAYTPVPPPVPNRPQDPNVRADRVAGALIAGCALVAASVVMVASRFVDLAGSPVFLALGVALVVTGVGIAIAGAFGRRAPGAGSLAVLGLVVALVAGSAGLVSRSGAHYALASDASLRPSNVAELSRGINVVAGSATVDLTRLDRDELESIARRGEPVDLEALVVAGTLHIILPDDLPTTVEMDGAASTLEWHVGDDSQRSGTGTFSTPDVESGGATPLVVFEIDAAAATVTVTEGN